MKPNNPSAFPEVVTTDRNYDDPHRPFAPDTHSEGGMTLRDYFAAKAMQSVIAEIDFKKLVGQNEAIFASGAALSFAIADAMLEEREKQP